MFVFLLIFAFVIFIYIHLLFHWKVSNEIDIAHVMKPTKDNLETIANMREPFIFENPINSSLHLEGSELLVNIKKMKDTPIRVSHKGMLSAIKKEAYLSEGNNVFLDKTVWDKDWKDLNTYLTPPMNLWEYHDILYGNQGVYTDLRQSLNYRNYIVVLDGTVEIKLSPPESEIKKNMNVWENENNITTILVPLKKGSIIHIPSYWWWSIKMPEFSSVLLLSYSTYMNALSQLPRKINKLVASKQ
jgi:hypothetical protein